MGISILLYVTQVVSCSADKIWSVAVWIPNIHMLYCHSLPLSDFYHNTCNSLGALHFMTLPGPDSESLTADCLCSPPWVLSTQFLPWHGRCLNRGEKKKKARLMNYLTFSFPHFLLLLLLFINCPMSVGLPERQAKKWSKYEPQFSLFHILLDLVSGKMKTTDLNEVSACILGYQVCI